MPHRAKERALIAQTLIDLVRIMRSRRLNGAGSAETLLILAAVVAGDGAGKPRNATDISRLLRIPRPTVVRKLAELVSAGLTERIGTRYYMTRVPLDPDYIDAAMSIIRRANV